MRDAVTGRARGRPSGWLALSGLTLVSILTGLAPSLPGPSTPAPWAAAPTAQHPGATPPAEDDAVVLTPAEVALALEFSPLPAPPPDPTNAVADDPAAARLGQALFFDPRLSGPGNIACASCHDPALGFADGRRLAKAVAHHPRHTQSLWNVAYNRWFFWDGRKDTLWSQALAPFEDPREHGGSRLQIVHTLAADDVLVRAYEGVFGAFPDVSDHDRFPAAGRPVPGDEAHPHALAWNRMTPEDRAAVDTVFVGVGKAIAAYERRLISRRAPFDVFVEGLREDDPAKQRALSASAQRGFALFAGKGRCLLCHDGPNFTDLEFHSNRVPTGEGVDPGRALGVLRLLDDPFNSSSVFADDGGASGRAKLALPAASWEVPGEFKTPTLRNVATTAPYMHEGQLQTLAEVIEFYSTLERAAAPGPHAETILVPAGLTAAEQADLLAFLEALTDESLPQALRRAPESPIRR